VRSHYDKISKTSQPVHVPRQSQPQIRQIRPAAFPLMSTDGAWVVADCEPGMELQFDFSRLGLLAAKICPDSLR
jgi:hypothetical protein